MDVDAPVAGSHRQAAVDKAAVQLLVPQLAAAQDAAVAAARSVPGIDGGQVAVLDPPHISLGYPWTRAPGTELVAHSAAQLLPVTVELGAVTAFPPDPRGRRTLHVPVLDGGMLQDLATQLGWEGVITPHCSLVRSRDPAALSRARAAAAPQVPVAVRLTTVEVTAYADGRWHQALRWDADDHTGSESPPP